jgi:GxxExxY protein
MRNSNNNTSRNQHYGRHYRQQRYPPPQRQQHRQPPTQLPQRQQQPPQQPAQQRQFQLAEQNHGMNQLLSPSRRILVNQRLADYEYQTQQRARRFIEQGYRPPPSINSLQALSVELPRVCDAIVRCIGASHSEGTYQNCLGIHLNDMGIHVEYEVEIPLVYQAHHVVTTRRADLVLTLPNVDGLQVVLELKKGCDIEQEHIIEQLHLYMHLLNINHGFLIGFPSSIRRRWELGHLQQENVSRSLYYVGVQGVSDRFFNEQESTFEFDDFSDEGCQIIQASFDQRSLSSANHRTTSVPGNNQRHTQRFRVNGENSMKVISGRL